LPIDAEITTLKTARGVRAPKLRDLPPLGEGTAHSWLQAAGELVPFCPYREMRAHWLPFALQVARIEDDAHRTQSAANARAVADLENARRALEQLCRNRPGALAQSSRHMLSSWSSPERGAPVSTGEPVGVAVEAAEGSPRVNWDVVADYRAKKALQQAEDLGLTIRLLLSHAKAKNRQIKRARRDQDEWRISFASVMGFTWRRYTGQDPSMAKQFITFVSQAFASIGPEWPNLQWDNSCREACARYRGQFEQVEDDSTLAVISWPVWEGIELERRPIEMDLSEKSLRAIVDHLRR